MFNVFITSLITREVLHNQRRIGTFSKVIVLLFFLLLLRWIRRNGTKTNLISSIKDFSPNSDYFLVVTTFLNVRRPEHDDDLDHQQIRWQLRLTIKLNMSQKDIVCRVTPSKGSFRYRKKRRSSIKNIKKKETFLCLGSS